MTRIVGLLVALVAGASLPAPAPTPEPVGSGLAATPEARHPHAEAEAIDWARERFALVGLDLPQMRIVFDPTKRACGAAEGRYRYDGEIHVVTICTRAGDSFRADLERRRTLLHEFAHAWDTVNLDHADRARLLADLGVARWHDPDADWADRGAERFAEVFVFALLDQPLRQLKVPGQCSAMIALFVGLTGHQPLGPGAPTCLTDR